MNNSGSKGKVCVLDCRNDMVCHFITSGNIHCGNNRNTLGGNQCQGTFHGRQRGDQLCTWCSRVLPESIGSLPSLRLPSSALAFLHLLHTRAHFTRHRWYTFSQFPGNCNKHDALHDSTSIHGAVPLKSALHDEASHHRSSINDMLATSYLATAGVCIIITHVQSMHTQTHSHHARKQ